MGKRGKTYRNLRLRYSSSSSDRGERNSIRTPVMGWDEIAAIMTIVGGVFIMFSKEKNEDEFIVFLRLNALSWAVLTNCAILLFAVVFVYDFPFFWVLVGNMFTIPIIFIFRFYWLLHSISKKNGD